VQAARELGLDEKRLFELRNEAIASLALTDLRRLRRWEGWPQGSAAGFAFDSQLEHYARSDHEGNLRVHRVGDDREIVRLPGDGAMGAAIMVFSPAGDVLAVRHFGTLAGRSTNFRLWDWRGRRTISSPRFRSLGALGFSRTDGTWPRTGRRHRPLL
jgi:hypothetical protein